MALKLKPFGFNIRQIAQEHSYVPYMWQRISKPDILIFLDVSYTISMMRKKLNWNEAEFYRQQKRLVHARENAHLIIDTNLLTPDQVLTKVLDFLRNYNSGNS